MTRKKGGLRNLVLLLQGQLVTNAGNQVYDLAMLLWIKELTGSATIMGLALLLTNLPETILAPLGGKVADRYGKVRTLVVADLVGFLAMGLLLATVLAGAGTWPLIVGLSLCNMVLGAAGACFVPAVTSLVPLLVSRANLARANAAQQFCGDGGRLLGQGGGGLIFTVLGPAGALAANAVSFLLSAGSEALIRAPEDKPAGRPSNGQTGTLLAETKASLILLWEDRTMRRLVLYIGAFHIFMSCLPVTLPFYAQHAVKVSEGWFGFLVAAYTLGIMLGFILAGSSPAPKRRLNLIALMSTLVGLLFLAVGAVASFGAAWTILVCLGAGVGVIVVNLMTELQLRSPEDQRGGIMGAAHAIGGCSLPLGMALTGILIDLAVKGGLDYEPTVRMVIILSGLGAMGVGLFELFSQIRSGPGRETSGERLK